MAFVWFGRSSFFGFPSQDGAKEHLHGFLRKATCFNRRREGRTDGRNGPLHSIPSSPPKNYFILIILPFSFTFLPPSLSLSPPAWTLFLPILLRKVSTKHIGASVILGSNAATDGQTCRDGTGRGLTMIKAFPSSSPSSSPNPSCVSRC